MHQQLQKNKTTILLLIFGICTCAIILASYQATFKLKKQTEETLSSVNEIKKVNTDDHIFGNNNASIVVVEYNDILCIWCKKFEQLNIREQLLQLYGDKITFVVRNFPLTELHSSAQVWHQYAECLYSYKGQEAYISFLKRATLLLEENSVFDPDVANKLYPITEKEKLELLNCYENKNSDAYKKNHQKIINDIFRGGLEYINKTPSFIIYKNNVKVATLNGRYSTLKDIIEVLIEK